VQLHYSIKANPHAQPVAHLASQVDGMDVASHAELLLALGSGVSAENISFSGPGKTDIELQAAITAGVVIHAESIDEINRAHHIGKQMRKPPQVAIRINPDFTVKQSGMVMAGGAQPFGMDLDQVDVALCTLKAKNIDCVGLHCYAGSQMLNAELVGSLQAQTLNMMSDIVLEHDLRNISLNLGGGFGIPYFGHESALDIQSVGSQLTTLINSTIDPTRNLAIVIELGRYLTAESGIYLSRIIEKKYSRGKHFLVVAGGMNHHLAASGNLGQTIRRNFPVKASPLASRAMTDEKTENVTIVGPLCTPLDILASDVVLPVLQPGDHIAILNSGAYGYSASPHQFLSHPTPAELLL